MQDFRQHKLMALSFAVATPDRVNLWPAATGDEINRVRQGRARGSDYASLNRQGAGRAIELIEYIEVEAAPMVLGHVINAMIDQGEYGALEIGFCHEIAERLMGQGTSMDEYTTVTDKPGLRLVVDND